MPYPNWKAGRLVAIPSLAFVPGTRNGRRFRTASGPVLGPFVNWNVSSTSVNGTLRLLATAFRSGRGPSLRTSRGPQMNASL